MAQVSFQLQAATDSALTALLLQHGLLLVGEGSPSLAPGVLYSHIGDATLEGGDVKLSGRYAFVSLNEAVFGEAAAASLLLALDAHIYKGPDIRILLGGQNFNSANAVPFAVTSRQAKSALLNAGWLGSTDEQVEANGYALFDGMPEPQRSLGRIAWRESNEFQRNNVWVVAMLQALGKTSAQGDALVVAAKAI